MIAGAVHRSFGEKNDAKLYRRIVSHWEVQVQLWPREKKTHALAFRHAHRTVTVRAVGQFQE